jgi:hypothetical protein
MKFFKRPETIMYAVGSVITAWAIGEDSKNAREWREHGHQPPIRYVPGIGAYTEPFDPKKAEQQPTIPGRGM